jgi:hypothetical protein
MGTCTKVNLKMETDKAKGLTLGLMAVTTVEIGWLIR